jgi:hypothetical protein
VHLPPRGEIKSAPAAAALHLVSEIYGCSEFKDYESGFNLSCCLIVWILIAQCTTGMPTVCAVDDRPSDGPFARISWLEKGKRSTWFLSRFWEQGGGFQARWERSTTPGRDVPGRKVRRQQANPRQRDR